ARCPERRRISRWREDGVQMTNTGDSRPLSAKQRRLLAAMAEHRTLREAAAAAGVGETAAYQWQRLPAFKQALHDLEHQTVNEAARQLLSLTGKATAALEEVLDDPIAKAGDSIRAARTILELTLRVREIVTLEDRIAELERRIGIGESA
ncbi:MAG: hypothetical protein KDJ36_16820, partial [Hyphomicrobiaceae bacterium]|nr:hypothetical protein [Hyphomicrobiaceae bacterium]